jgi:hypothetical protein
MGVVKLSTPPGSRQPAPSERLDSWKEIAAYLKRDESTVRRWEAEGLPVHRHPHKKKATAYAYKSELDLWCVDGHSRLEAVAAPDSGRSRPRTRWATAGMMLLGSFALALTVVGTV